MWPEANIGVQVIRSCPCGSKSSKDEGILEATRYCGGDFINGAIWSEANIAACNFSDLTREICDLINVCERNVLENNDCILLLFLATSCKESRTTGKPYQ